MNSSFRSRLKQGDVVIGTLITLPCQETAEILANAGFDWLFLDTEHAPLDAGSAQGILQAADGSCPCVIRVPCNEATHIKKALDLGPAGIIVPQVNSADEARQAVRWSRYPPLGERSVGISRAHGYGMSFQQYVDTANDEIAVIVQAEHVEAVNNIESILEVDGLDAILIGPYDLSGSLGKPGNVSDPEVQSCIERVRKSCQDVGMPLGIFGVDPAAVKPFIEQGYSLISVGTDTLLLGKAAQETLAQLR